MEIREQKYLKNTITLSRESICRINISKMVLLAAEATTNKSDIKTVKDLGKDDETPYLTTSWHMFFLSFKRCE
jgi:hypothetical protein